MPHVSTVPTHARVVIIGGGIVGCSTAYHLAKLGWDDVVVLERKQLTSGSSFHAAGLVGQLRSSANITQLLQYSVEFYDALEAETGQATGWKRNGGLRLACSEERLVEIKRQATTARSFGLEMHILTPQEALSLWPIMDISDVVAAAYLPTDGQANPSDITQALAKGARKRGARIFEQCPVTGFRIDAGRIVGVETGKGDIGCEVLVNCAGQWSKAVAREAGVNVPIQSVQHQYLITEPIAGIPTELPTLRDPDRLIYFKEEVGGLVMGGYEQDPIPWALEGIPEDFYFTLLDPDWDHFEGLMTQALGRVPPLETAQVKELINGPEAFTPDGNFILGEAPEVKGYFVGCGFNSFGIASAGGAGRALAEWIIGGEPSVDLWPVDIRRFANCHRDETWVRQRTLEAYSKHYTMAWPHEEHQSGRPLRVSPLYQRLKEGGACFGSKLGWERPNWFAPLGTEPKDEYSYARQNWFEAVGAEHRACRERVALFDATSFAKFILVGRDAEAALSWIASNDVARATGALVYTQMLNRRGGIECDLTITRLAADRYYIVTGTGFVTHNFNWISRNIPAGMDATLVDVTSAHAVLSLMGPRARDALQALSRDDVSNAAFPFATGREITLAGAPVRALRVTYVGELGWELHVPTEYALGLYQRLMEVGEQFGIANAGYRAIESLRLEKGYRAWGADIGPDYTPIEAGLAWAVKLNSEHAFLGRDALQAQMQEGVKKRLAGFSVEDPHIVLLGRETILRNGERVGWLSSGGWGYTVGKNIGYGYVRNGSGVTTEFLTSGSYELEVATERVPAILHLAPLYDPKMERVRG